MKRSPSFFANRELLFRLATVVVLVVIVTALHYSTGTSHFGAHGIYRRLYYVPIILGGIWFGLPGGSGLALLVSVLYAPHVLFQWGDMPDVNLEQYLEITLYNVIGFLTGILSSKERAQRHRSEENAKKLSNSYNKLREQSELIVEIEDQLRRADRLTALGELSAGMAHEIRNPLGSIRGVAEILQEAFPPDNKYTEFTRILITEADRLNQVLEDFLNFVHAESEESSVFDPGEVLRETLLLSQAEANRYQVDLSWDHTPLPVATGNAVQFKQVFLNLILNAIQAMPSGGRLQILGGVENGRILLRFRDTGPGVPSALLDRIFNPFFTTKDKGTGLGLAITHRIVQVSRAHLKVLNNPEGGAEFILSLQQGTPG